jgi:hypothetical protein
LASSKQSVMAYPDFVPSEKRTCVITMLLGFAVFTAVLAVNPLHNRIIRKGNFGKLFISGGFYY